MTTLHAGTAGFNAPRTRYARKLRFVEFSVREPQPLAKALTRWREELGEDFVFSAVAPDALWGEKDFPLRDAKRTQTETDRLANLLGHLRPRVLVLKSPPDIRPGSAAFKRMREWLPRWAKMAPVVVWEPYGLWERDVAMEAVAGTGILVAADPLRDDVSAEPVVYARMKGLGADRRYHEGKLEDLGAALAHTEECFVVFDTATGFVEARKLRALADGGGLVPSPDATFEGDDLAIDTGELDEDEDEDEDEDDEDDESDDDGEESDEGEEASDEDSDEDDFDDEDDEDSDEDEDEDDEEEKDGA